MNDVIEVSDSQQSLKTVGHISYFLHAVVAVGAVLPGVQASVLLLLIAFFIDMVKRDDARGTWQESHFSWRIRSVVWAGVLYLVTWPLWLLFLLPGVQASVLLLLIAFFLDMFKREDARGTWQESHFSWRIRSVLWAGGLYLVTAPLWLLFLIPGWIAWGIISLWFLYRIARGWLNLSSNTPMPMPA